MTTFAGAGVGSGTDTTTQVDTPGLASATTLTALNSNGVVWGNANNTSTPYLLPYSPGNPQTVYLASDTSNTPTAYTLVFDLTQLQNIANNLGGYSSLAQEPRPRPGSAWLQPDLCSARRSAARSTATATSSPI